MTQNLKKIFLTTLLVISLHTTAFSQITSLASGSWSASTTWAGGVVPTATDNVIIAAGHVVTLNVATAECNDLTINGSSASLRFAIDGTVTGLTVHGNVLINSGGRMRVENRNPAGAANSYVEHTLTLYGNLTNKGTLDLRGGSTSGGTSNGVLTTFTGSSNSTISLTSTNYQGSVEEFNGITINKSNGAKVILASGNLFMSSSSTVGPSILTLTNGIVETGNNIWAYLATNGAGIVGASQSSYIKGTLGRGMNSSGTTEKIFYIGDSVKMRPITVRTTTGGVSSGHYVFVRLLTGSANNGSSVLSNGIDSVSSVRYYQIGYSKGGVTTASDSMTFSQFTPTYNVDDNLQEGANGLTVAYSTDGKTTWVGAGPTNHVTDLSNPPTEIQCTAISPVLVLKDAGSLFVALAHLTDGNTGLTPDSANAKYGPYTLNQFDFWKAKSTKPTPLVIWIHGGGLTQGSKVDVSTSLVEALIAKGISVASINYRLTPEVVIPQHYMDCARAIQYFRYHAAELNIDPNKVAAGGSSAGALTSFWLAFHDDLADAANADPILRMSTRLACVANWSGQTSIDKRDCLAWIGPKVLEFSYFTGAVFGISADSMDTPSAYATFEMASPYNWVTKDDPAAWMYYTYVDTPATSSEAIHHVNFGYHLKAKMDSLGLESSILTPAYTGSVTTSAVNFYVNKFSAITDVNGVVNAAKKEFRLEQNYPNPFNPSTLINFRVAQTEHVVLKIYDALGREIKTLVNEVKPQGEYHLTFNASGLPSGIYFYSLRAGSYSETKKMMLIK
jgi:hypothetical protein